MRYTVSIVFNYGRDEASRQVKSTHRTLAAAARAAASLARAVGEGWVVEVAAADGAIDWRRA